MIYVGAAISRSRRMNPKKCRARALPLPEMNHLAQKAARAEPCPTRSKKGAINMKKERVQAAISHIQPDITPYNIELCSTLADAVCKQCGIPKAELYHWLGNHIEKISYNRGTLEGDIYTDEFGVQWDRSGADKDIGIIHNYLLTEPSMGGYALPEPDLAFVRQSTEKAVENNADTFKFGKIGTALFERAWSLRGFENFLMDLACEDEFVAELLDKITDFQLSILDTALEYDIDGIYLGDDFGTQNGLLMSPDTWRRHFKPRFAQIFDRTKRAGKIAALHSCGDITLILDDLIEIGLDIYQTVQPEIYDLAYIKKRYGNNLTFWGGISTQQTLPFVEPAELKQIVRDTVAVMGKGGGYIAAPTHQVPFDVPIENIIAMAEALRGQV